MQNKVHKALLSSEAELTAVYQAVAFGVLSVADAAQRVGISRRQMYRRLEAWNANNGKLPPHGNTGRVAKNRLPDAVHNKILELAETKYFQFPPQLLTQYLNENEGITVSKETVRRILREANPEVTEQQLREAGHLLRRRRSRFGELIQIDGSPHQWFVNDPHQYCLIAFIDDATGRITAARFYPTETAGGYFLTLVAHIKQYGIPLALYSDRHSIFRQNRPDVQDEETQFKRACDQLGIELIYALSPQAKGRIERLFQTLQNRWPLEFRVQGISDMDTANKRLPEFIADFNARFSISPRSVEDAHSPVELSVLPLIERTCAYWYERVVSKNLTVSYGGTILQITKAEGRMYELIGQTVHIIEYPNKALLEIHFRDSKGKGHLLHYKALIKKTLEPVEYLETSKTINARMDAIVDAALHGSNHFVERHYKEAADGLDRKAKRVQRDKDAKALMEKIAKRNE